jgi:hypothetical protein
MSRGHETDYQILRWLLPIKGRLYRLHRQQKKDCAYERGLARGWPGEAQIARLHAPIGLAICAQTPAESRSALRRS